MAKYLLVMFVLLAGVSNADDTQNCDAPAGPGSLAISDVYLASVAFPIIAYDQDIPTQPVIRPKTPVTNICQDLCSCSNLPAYYTIETERWCRTYPEGQVCEFHINTDCLRKNDVQGGLLWCRTCGGL